MDFAKYVAMLNDGALYFARLDTLGDPFEGSLSKSNYELLRQIERAGEASGKLPPDWRGRYFDVLMGSTRRARKQCYVSCWHMNSAESEAMWRLYSSSGYAIAVVTTYAQLACALPSEFEPSEYSGPYLGVVRYADHQTDATPSGNIFDPVMHKRPSFQHEQECRAVLWRHGPRNRRTAEPLPESVIDAYASGVRLCVELQKLIQRVTVSPHAPSWFATSVKDVTQRYGLGFPVEQSSLNLLPYL